MQSDSSRDEPAPPPLQPQALPALHGDAVVIGGGPAGLMAAEVLAQGGVAVHLFDAMPSVGRKFLLAGKGGLNLTHSEPQAAFAARYGAREPQIAPLLAGSDFGRRFVDKGPMRTALEQVSVRLVEHGQLGVTGAASWYLEQASA